MSTVLMLALQVAAPAPAAIDFDLARHRPQAAATNSDRACPPGEAGEIVVCGRRDRNGDYPLDRWARTFAAPRRVAEIGIGGAATMRAYGESVGIGPGVTSNRAMIGIRLPF